MFIFVVISRMQHKHTHRQKRLNTGMLMIYVIRFSGRNETTEEKREKHVMYYIYTMITAK